MSLRTPELAVEIAVANVDLYPWDLPGKASWGSNLEQLEPYLAATGCRSFEIHPMEAMRADVEHRFDAAQQGQSGEMDIASQLIGSQHARFSLPGVVGKIINRTSRRFDPDRSLVEIDEIQSKLPKSVPAVVYAHKMPTVAQDPTSTAPGRIFPKPMQDRPEPWPVVQPFPEVYRDFGVWSNEDLLRAVARIGIIGLCPDTVHARRKAADGSRSPAIVGVWADQFASGRVFQMHASADRFDIGKWCDPDTAAKSVREFRAFTSRRWQDALETEMGDMITAAIENWVPPVELAQAVGKPVLRMVVELTPRPQAILHRVKDHAQFVYTLANLVHEVGARPLLWGGTV